MFVFLQRLKPFIGPKRFIFVDPDTNYRFEEKTKEALVKRIVSYRAANELPELEELSLVLENYWCGLPENIGSCEACPKLKRGFYAYLKGGVALVQNLYYGAANIVEKEVADNRAKICVSCPANKFLDKGLFVKWSDNIAEASTHGLKSAYYKDLGNCECCSCTLKAKVFFKGPFSLSDEERYCMRKSNPGCWQLKEK